MGGSGGSDGCGWMSTRKKSDPLPGLDWHHTNEIQTTWVKQKLILLLQTLPLTPEVLDQDKKISGQINASLVLNTVPIWKCFSIT